MQVDGKRGKVDGKERKRESRKYPSEKMETHQSLVPATFSGVLRVNYNSFMTFILEL